MRALYILSPRRHKDHRQRPVAGRAQRPGHVCNVSAKLHRPRHARASQGIFAATAVGSASVCGRRLRGKPVAAALSPWGGRPIATAALLRPGRNNEAERLARSRHHLLAPAKRRRPMALLASLVHVNDGRSPLGVGGKWRVPVIIRWLRPNRKASTAMTTMHTATKAGTHTGTLMPPADKTPKGAAPVRTGTPKTGGARLKASDPIY